MSSLISRSPNGPRLGGMIAAMMTPFVDAWDLDLETLPRYAEWLVEEGASGIAVNTDAGEGIMLSSDERRTVVQAVTKAVNGRVPVIAGIPGQPTPVAVREASTAAADGADGILVFPHPSFRAASSDARIVTDYYDALAEAGLPMVAFQLGPQLGGALFSREIFAHFEAMGNVVAIKEASFDAFTFVATRDALREVAPSVALLTGNDSFIFESLILGADGGLLGLAAIETRLQADLAEAAAARDVERAERLRPLIDDLARVMFAMPQQDYRARIKAGLVHQGILPSASVRPPFRASDEMERQTVVAVLERLTAARERQGAGM
jgi:4-hydroxy-tetrahydrodipicolinate synthase